MALVLASSSAARLALLRNAGVAVTARPARIDEAAVRAAMTAEGAGPRDVAGRLAEAKAMKIGARDTGALVLGADQVLAAGENILGKSETREAAAEVLKRLRGTRHSLYSAAVLCRGGRPVWRHVGVVRLTMRDFSDAFLAAYLDRNWPAVSGAVGAYHLEGEGARLFSRVEGDFFNVLGLPLIELLSYLTETGEIDG